MKILLTAILTLTILNAFADEETCGADTDALVTKISATTTCYDASNLILSCVQGTSSDLVTVQATTQICEAEYGGREALDESDKNLLREMEDRCTSVYAAYSGDESDSSRAFCYLRAYSSASY